MNSATPKAPDQSAFATLAEALSWVESLIRAGLIVLESRISADRFPRYKPRHRMGKLLGISPKAERIARRYAPDGKWIVHCERQDVVNRPGPTHQFSVFYDRYTPYAVAMMNAEHSFTCLGLDHTSINSYWKTCMGYYYLGMDHTTEEDALEYDAICTAARRVYRPSLPFDEVYLPAAIWCCLYAPREYFRHYRSIPDCWVIEKTRQTLEQMNRPIPSCLLRLERMALHQLKAAA